MVQKISNSPAIDQAVSMVKELSADKQMRLEAEAREKALRDSFSETEEENPKG